MDLPELGIGSPEADKTHSAFIERGDRPKVIKLPGESRKDYLRRWQANYRKYHGADYNAYRDSLRDKDRNKTNAITRKSYHKNKHKHAEKEKLRREKNKAENYAKQKEWKKKNPERVRDLARNWRLKNKDRANSKLRENFKKRFYTDLEFRILKNCRSRMGNSVIAKSAKKLSTTVDLLGCTPLEFKAHLESQFDDKMSWDNYGSYWSIDHIKPLSKFDLTIPEEQLKAFHYTNCQPLEKIENIKKSNKITPEVAHALGQSSNTNSTPSYP